MNAVANSSRYSFSTSANVACSENIMRSYRYGFNGMEKDDELKGQGNSYDFGARMYDLRVGRWLSNDPAFRDYPSISPYVFAINSPNWFIDVNGKWVVEIQKNNAGKYELVFIAEEGDNLETLAIQLGLDKKTLVNAEPSIESLNVTSGVKLFLANVQQVSSINSGINFVGENQSTTNCSALADNCDGGSTLSVEENGFGTDVENFENKIIKEYEEVLQENAKIGDVVTYKLIPEWINKEKMALIESSSARKKFYERDPEMALKIFAKDMEDISTKERHFSVIVLLNKDGSAPALVIQKNGREPFDFKVDSINDTTVPADPGHADLEYEQSPVKGKEQTIYRSKIE